jgi:hypothetical protein
MEDKITNLVAKRLISEYNFLQSDDSYKKELIDLHKEDFLKRISEKSPKRNPEEPDPKAQEKLDALKQEDPIEIKNEKTKDKIKQIYRSIAKKTHPDRTTNEDYIKKYIEATFAHDSNNLFDLYLIANELEIKVEFDQSDFEMLAEIIKKKKKEISSLEGSFVWLFINAPNEEEKEKIVDIYVNKYC